MNRLRADALLLLAALIWGTAFVAQKSGNASMGPLSFVGVRFFLAALVLIPLVLWERKKQSLPLGLKDFALAGTIGVCLFLGNSLQQIGLLTTTVSNAGFLTALYVVLVPFVIWLLKRERPSVIVVAACCVSIVGAWLLTDNGATRSWAAGDVLIVISDIAWAIGISLVPIYLKRTNRPLLLCFLQYSIAATLGLMSGWALEPLTAQGFMTALPALLYAGLISGGIAFTLQIVAQKHTPPAEAALIMSLESVFAAASGALLLRERLTPLALTGCALILLGVVLVEVGPLFLTPKRSV